MNLLRDHLLHSDPVLLHALLTALVAPATHLLVRTPEQDVSLVARLVVWTLSTIFDCPAHRAKVRPRPPNGPTPSTKQFIKSLFFTNPAASSASTHTSQDESSDPTKSRRPKSRHSRTMQPHLTHVRQPDPVATHLHVDPFGLSNKSTTGRLPTESLPHRNYILKENTAPPQLSPALVLSGIENATLESQRTLARVIADNRITFDSASDSKAEESWDLPDGFIVVYVCAIDPRERPNIHHSLLDKFAMSCNVLIKPNVRQAIQSSISPSNTRLHHSNTSSPLVNSHISLPPSSRLSLHRQSYHSASASISSVPRDPFHTPVLPKNFISNLRKAYLKTYISPTLMTYLHDLFSATRHRAELDGTFLTARCMSDAEKLVRAHRVVSTDLNGMELLRDGDDDEWLLEGQDDEERDNDEDEEHDHDDDENSDEQWQTVEADELSSFGITFPKSVNSKKQPPTVSSTVSSTSKSKIKPQQINTSKNEIPKLEVTEINIARMFPRCVSHRLRVRDGPREEVLAASLLFGATFDFEDETETGGREVYVGTYEERPTVKDVLVSILSEV